MKVFCVFCCKYSGFKKKKRMYTSLSLQGEFSKHPMILVVHAMFTTLLFMYTEPSENDAS